MFSGVAEKDEQARHLNVQPPATGARRYEVSRTRRPRRIRLHAAAGGLQGPRLLLQSLLEVGALGRALSLAPFANSQWTLQVNFCFSDFMRIRFLVNLELFRLRGFELSTGIIFSDPYQTLQPCPKSGLNCTCVR